MNLELERKKLEIKKVTMAKCEMEFKILERQADIERLKLEMENQDKRVLELEEIIKEMENK